MKIQLQKNSHPRFLENSFIFWSLVTSVLLIIILVLVIFFKLKPSSEFMALHYNVLIGVDVVKQGWYSLVLPALATLVLIYNLFLAKKLCRFEPFAAYQLLTASVLTSAIFLVAAFSLTNLP